MGEASLLAYFHSQFSWCSETHFGSNNLKIKNTLKGQTVIEGLPDKNLPSTMPKENFDAFPCTIWEGEM